MKYYKVLSGGKSCNGGDYVWDLPTKNSDGTWTPGKWTEKINGDLIPYKNGYHICGKNDLVCWLDKEIYEAEYRGEIIRNIDNYTVREVRLLCKIETWNEKVARLFAADCAERVLPNYEAQYPNDKRLRLIVKAARDYANGKITSNELSIVAAEAQSVVVLAAKLSKQSTGKISAWSAAESAIRTIMQSNIEIAAHSAARLAAESASESAVPITDWFIGCPARINAEISERKWQTKRLCELLGI